MKTAVIGASGYAGGELLRLLAIHPHFEVTVVSAHSNAGEQVTSVHPQLQSYAGRSFVATDSIDFSTLGLVFLALPHGESASLIAKIPAHVKIVDLGADFRLEDPAQWEKYYGGKYAGAWVYGLPELAPGQREAIKNENKVANPGCYATSISIGIAPALNLVDVSAKINLLGSEVMSSLTSYKFGGVHQHTPEIEQALSAVAQKPAMISFTPILAPMPRGILSTITARLKAPLTTEQAHDLFSRHYASEFFVDVLTIGQMPKTSAVIGSNKVQLQVAVDQHTQRLVVSVAIDNLGKGAAGQAIQNANLICGLAEISGLALDGIGA
jgi:N-acetyl-gamma-glutamyl-phosphate reductase